MAKKMAPSRAELHSLVQAALDDADAKWRSAPDGSALKMVQGARANAFAAILSAMEGNPDSIAYLRVLRRNKGESHA